MNTEAKIYLNFNSETKVFIPGEEDVEKLDVRIRDGKTHLTVFYDDGSVECFIDLPCSYISKDPRRIKEYKDRKKWVEKHKNNRKMQPDVDVRFVRGRSQDG